VARVRDHAIVMIDPLRLEDRPRATTLLRTCDRGEASVSRASHGRHRRGVRAVRNRGEERASRQRRVGCQRHEDPEERRPCEKCAWRGSSAGRRLEWPNARIVRW
jgi:hypothetical protein